MKLGKKFSQLLFVFPVELVSLVIIPIEHPQNFFMAVTFAY